MEGQIKTQDYEVVFEPDNRLIYLKGSFWLSGQDEYAPIVQLLNQAINQEQTELTLNVQQVDFLNSSGINVISKFVIGVRQKGTIELTILGSKKIPWQTKSLVNFKRLLPSLKLDLES